MSLRLSGRVALAALATVVAATALTACSSGASSSTSDAPPYSNFNLQLSWIKNSEFSGEFFADSKGYYKDAGFTNVTLTPGPSTGVSELVSGTAQVALSDAVSIGTAVATQGAPLKIIGATYQKNPFTILSLADKANITKPSDLKGKKIGVQDSNLALFKALLAANGLTTSDVTIVPVQYDPSVLTQGQVDGFVAYLTNEAITVASQGFTVANLPFADNGLPFVAETFTTTDDMIKNHPKELEAFLKAEIQGWTDAVNDPAAGAKLAVEVYGKDKNLNLEDEIKGATAQAQELVVSDETKQNGLFTISSSLQDATIKSLAGAGITVTASQLFDMSLLNAVYAANPSLKNYAK